ncbi:MAG TPA: hypothetical protein VL175_06225 [Pirellulales bacterium]|jgi:hypothetical protein|nr:hypothetical protein [Pirellulales bacterium]
MSSYLHVLNTYFGRWRFWIFGGFYVLMAWLTSGINRERSPGIREWDALGFIVFSTIIASLFMAFLALHVRRQFGSPQAHVMPGFFAPHFAVFVAVSSVIWIVIPWLMAERSQWPALPFVSAHACAAILLCLIVIWPRALVLLLGMFLGPVLIFGNVGLFSRAAQIRFAQGFVEGEFGGVYFVLIALALAAYVCAAWRLRRLSDLSAATSDDFSLEIKNEAYTNRASFGILQDWRDQTTESRLAAIGPTRDSVRLRWVPSATSIPEIAILGVLIVALGLAVWYFVGESGAAVLVFTVGTAAMVFGPLSTWRFRLNALATEVMRPATRRQAFRRVVMAMALDFLIWGVAATLVVACSYLFLIGERGFFYRSAILIHLMALWGAIVLIFGVTLATLRFRYWVPLFLGLVPGIMVACLLGAVMLATLTYPVSRGRRDDVRYGTLAALNFALSCSAVGLLLSRYSYRKLLEADLQ